MGLCDGGTLQKLKVEYSPAFDKTWNDGTHTWTAVTGVTGTLTVSGGDRQEITFESNSGRKNALGSRASEFIDLVVQVLNSASSFLEFLTDTVDGTDDPCFYIRWSLNEGASGALRRTAKVAVQSSPHFGGDPGATQFNTKQIRLLVDSELGIKRDTVA